MTVITCLNLQKDAGVRPEKRIEQKDSPKQIYSEGKVRFDERNTCDVGRPFAGFD